MPRAAALAILAVTLAATAGLAHAQGDDARAKALDELGGMLEVVRSMGVDVPEPTSERAAPFVARMEAIAAEAAAAGGRDADGALEARATAVMAEYALAALEGSAQDAGAERAGAFLSRLAELSTEYSAAVADGDYADADALVAELDALMAEHGMLFTDAGDDGDSMTEMEENLEFIGPDGTVTRITGERAAEFLRRSDEIGARYAEAADMAQPESRAAALAALEAEHNSLLEEYGISTAPPPPSGSPEEHIEFVNADGETVKLTGERASEFLDRLDGLAMRYSEEYSSAPSAQRTEALAALEAEHDALLAEFGLDSGQPAAADKAEGASPQGAGDEPAAP